MFAGKAIVQAIVTAGSITIAVARHLVEHIGNFSRCDVCIPGEIILRARMDAHSPGAESRWVER
jgi:hypothetical protein